MAVPDLGAASGPTPAVRKTTSAMPVPADPAAPPSNPKKTTGAMPVPADPAAPPKKTTGAIPVPADPTAAPRPPTRKTTGPVPVADLGAAGEPSSPPPKKTGAMPVPPVKKTTGALAVPDLGATTIDPPRPPTKKTAASMPAPAAPAEDVDLGFTDVAPGAEVPLRPAQKPAAPGKRTSATVEAVDQHALTQQAPPTIEGPPPSDAKTTAPETSTGADIAPGAVLGGCKIEKRIGQGGMGRVYKGYHEGLDRPMAVKVLDEKLVARAGFVQQFVVEARTLAKLDHPNIVRVFNVDKDPGLNIHFLVMELLEGGSVEGLLKKHKDGKVPVDEAVRIAKEAAEGLHAAHKAGLIHRDVKPGNLMLTGDGRVKVVDFGLAVPTVGEVFVATGIAGTPIYMAPEQADGLRLDARCDQYALGVTLYHLLCGQPPFVRKKMVDILFAHMTVPPPSIREQRPEVPEWLESVVFKMLAKTPDERFPTLLEAVGALQLAGKGAKVEVAAHVEEKPQIRLQQLVELEKGMKPVPVELPSWKPAAMAALAAVVVGAIFLAGPVREVMGSSYSGNEVPRSLEKLVRDAQQKASSRRGLDVLAAIAQVEEALSELGGRPGARQLDDLRTRLKKDLEAIKASEEKALETTVLGLIQKKRWGAAIDLADPTSQSLTVLGFKGKLESLRRTAVESLAENGEAWVPAGEFSSGPTAEPARASGFYVERTEVTNAAWAEVMESAKLSRPASWPASGPMPPALAKKPVTGISFEEAKAYARARGKRLPTAREWEKAARGSSDARAWPWGPVFEPGRANLQDGGSGALEDVTARSGDLSPWGVLGMAGNALEWVDSPPSVAGGGFRSHALSGRVFSRFVTDPATRHPAIGFRCARDAD